MCQYRSGLLPYSFNNRFLVTRQVDSYGTRSSELFYLPQWGTNIRKFSISFQGPKFLTLLVLKFEMQQEPLLFAVGWMYSAYHKYIFLFLILFFCFLFFCHFAFFRLTMISTTILYILRFTVALPLIFPCVLMIIFCSCYLTEGTHSL